MTPSPKDEKFNIIIHPAAAIFPMIADDELMEMAKSITLHGLREKIQAVPEVHDDRTDWLVIDGRNRLEALRRMGIPDATIISDYIQPMNLAQMNATAEEYVVMANIERRNLTQPQRRELAGKLALMLAEQQKDLPKAEREDTLAKAAAAAGVSRRTAASAKQEAKTITGGAAKKPAKKKPAKKAQLPTPAVILDQLSKAHKSASKFGHNWPKQTGFEVFDKAVGLAAELAKKPEIAAEAETKLGKNWNKYEFFTSEQKS